MKRPTIVEIARLAEVSTATVSYVLNGKAGRQGISAATAERVRDVAEDLGYVPDRMATSLRTGRYHLIALIAPHFADFYADLLQGIEEEGDKSNYQIIISSTFDRVSREARYVQSLIGRRIDGAIVLPVDIHEPHLRRFEKARIPTVCFRRRAGSDLRARFMTFDDYGAGRMLTRRLIEVGCKRLAFYCPQLFLERDYLRIIHEARFAGFRRACEEAGLSCGCDGPMVLEERDEGVGARLSEEAGRRKADGIVGVSDTSCLIAMHHLKAHGIRVPDDIKIAGFDNVLAASVAAPPLTTIAWPKAELGRAMMQSLLNMMETREQQTDEAFFEPRLVVRQSG
jgi:LacI family transcriptional regulator